MNAKATPPPELSTAISYTILDACKVTGLGKSKLYELASAGKIRLVKVGRRSLIPATDLRNLVEGESAQ